MGGLQILTGGSNRVELSLKTAFRNRPQTQQEQESIIVTEINTASSNEWHDSIQTFQQCCYVWEWFVDAVLRDSSTRYELPVRICKLPIFNIKKFRRGSRTVDKIQSKLHTYIEYVDKNLWLQFEWISYPGTSRSSGFVINIFKKIKTGSSNRWQNSIQTSLVRLVFSEEGVVPVWMHFIARYEPLVRIRH
jgi:hypothetical protein